MQFQDNDIVQCNQLCNYDHVRYSNEMKPIQTNTAKKYVQNEHF